MAEVITKNPDGSITKDYTSQGGGRYTDYPVTTSSGSTVYVSSAVSDEEIAKIKLQKEPTELEKYAAKKIAEKLQNPEIRYASQESAQQSYNLASRYGFAPNMESIKAGVITLPPTPTNFESRVGEQIRLKMQNPNTVYASQESTQQSYNLASKFGFAPEIKSIKAQIVIPKNQKPPSITQQDYTGKLVDESGNVYNLSSKKNYPPQKGSIAEQYTISKTNENKFKERKEESYSSNLLLYTQDISKDWRDKVNNFIGISKDSIPGIKTGISGFTGAFTSLPETTGMLIFSGEQIVRHPSEISKILTVGLPMFVKQTKESIKEDPYKFTGSLAGIYVIGKSGKAIEVVKNIKYEEASGIRSLRESLPKIEPSSRLKDYNAAIEVYREMKFDISKELNQPTRGKEAIGAVKNLFEDYKTTISKELNQPTRGKEAIEAIKDISKSTINEPTRGKESLIAVKDIIKETKQNIIKEFEQPTIRKLALNSALEVSGEIVKDIAKTSPYRPEITNLKPSLGPKFLLGGERFISPEILVEAPILSGEERFPSASKGTTASQMLKEFKTSKFRIPGTEELKGGWHATPKTFEKYTETQVGTSESPGLFIAPSLSSHFLKVTPEGYKLFGIGSKPARPEAIFLETKDITRVPKYARVSGSKYNEFMLGKAEKGKAYIGSGFETGGKMEKQAIVTPETPIKSVNIKTKYATIIEGKKIPTSRFTTKIDEPLTQQTIKNAPTWVKGKGWINDKTPEQKLIEDYTPYIKEFIGNPIWKKGVGWIQNPSLIKYSVLINPKKEYESKRIFEKDITNKEPDIQKEFGYKLVEDKTKVKKNIITFEELSKKQQKDYERYYNYKEPLITPSKLLYESISKRNAKSYITPSSSSRTKKSNVSNKYFFVSSLSNSSISSINSSRNISRPPKSNISRPPKSSEIISNISESSLLSFSQKEILPIISSGSSSISEITKNIFPISEDRRIKYSDSETQKRKKKKFKIIKAKQIKSYLFKDPAKELAKLARNLNKTKKRGR